MGTNASSRTRWCRALCSSAIALTILGCNSSATDSVAIDTSAITISGSVQVPAQLSISRAKGAQLGKPQFSKADAAPTEETIIELIDSEGNVLDTTTANADGSYTFSQDRTELADAGNTDYLTCYVRSTTGDLVQISTLSRPAAEVTDDNAATAFADSDVTPDSTFATLMAYAGTDYNPLTAADGSAPPDVDIETLSDIVDAMVARAAAVLDDTTDYSTLGSTMDENMAAMFAAFRALASIDIDGMTRGESQHALCNFSGRDDPDAAAIGAAFGSRLPGIDATDLATGAETINSLDDVFAAWAGNPEFVTELGLDPNMIDLLIGASITGRTITEFESMNATDGLIGAQLDLLEHLDVAGLGGFDIDALIGAMSHFLDPAIILAMANDPDMAAAMQGIIDPLFDENFDPEAALLMAEAAAGNAENPTFWDGLMDGDAIDTEKLGNWEEFMYTCADSDDFAHVLTGDASMQWDDLFANIDFDQDYSTFDTAAFDAQYADDFNAAFFEFDKNSCQYFCGGHTGSCGCDDGCSERGDCCTDKVHACGENYLLTLMNQYGVDLGDTAFAMVDTTADSDGDGVADISDVCPMYYDTAQTDTDGDGQGNACVDSDHDGAFDTYDNCAAVSNPDQLNTDYWNDAEGDACDSDDDGDSVADATDNCPTAANLTQEDDDSDGIGNLCDGADGDGDGWMDAYDNCPTIDNADQLNSDYWNDAAGDACDSDDDSDDDADIVDNCPLTYNPAQTDSDSDGEGDSCDGTDSDWDGVLDDNDNCATMFNTDQTNTDGDADGDACDDDDDADGVADEHDNCRLADNANQADADSDNVGDACDGADADWDGIADGSDNCPNYYNPDQGDADSDGTGNSCDADYSYTPTAYAGQDSDSDGVIDSSDNCVSVSNADQADSDSDHVGNACDTADPTPTPTPGDTDTDGDSIADAHDNCPVQSNVDQTNNDADSAGDACDSSPTDPSVQ